MSRIHKKELVNLPIKYILIISCLLIFGLYKNGILLINYGFSDYKILFKLFLSIVIGLGLGISYDKFISKNNFINTAILLLLLLIIMPISISPWIYALLCGGYLVLDYFTRKLNFNIIAFIKVLSFIILDFFNTYNYLNLLEQSGQFNYNFLDKIIGYNVSSIYASSFILVFLAIAILIFDKYYKKEIFILGITSYLASLLILSLIQKDMLLFVTNALNSLVWFGIGIIAPIPNFSPLKKKKRYVYGVFLGILTLVLSIKFNFYEGVFMAIVCLDLMRIIFMVFCDFYVKKKEKKLILLNQKEEID